MAGGVVKPSLEALVVGCSPAWGWRLGCTSAPAGTRTIASWLEDLAFSFMLRPQLHLGSRSNFSPSQIGMEWGGRVPFLCSGGTDFLGDFWSIY